MSVMKNLSQTTFKVISSLKEAAQLISLPESRIHYNNCHFSKYKCHDVFTNQFTNKYPEKKSFLLYIKIKT